MINIDILNGYPNKFELKFKLTWIRFKRFRLKKLKGPCHMGAQFLTHDMTGIIL